MSNPPLNTKPFSKLQYKALIGIIYVRKLFVGILAMSTRLSATPRVVCRIGYGIKLIKKAEDMKRPRREKCANVHKHTQPEGSSYMLILL